MDPRVDDYLKIGCGRCPLVGTPECKVHSWHEPMVELRRILLGTGLTEELKWSQPCYTFDGKNVLLLAALKDHCSIGFFKGALLKDPKGLLVAPGKNSQAARQLRFTDSREVLEMENEIRAFIQEAIQVEKAGLKIEFKSVDQFEYPEELVAKFEADPPFRAAFEALTPGRQRGYLLFFEGAKQAATRIARIEKSLPRIFEGKGMHDR